jgi:hypothetical protein
MKILLISFSVAVLLTSCSKNNADAPVPAADNSIAKVKTWTSSYTSTYFYDAQGRLAKYENSNGSRVEQEYQPGIVIRKVYSNAGVFQYSYKNELNADGYLGRTTMSSNPNYEILYVYNPDKTLAKQISTISGSHQVIDYFYSNGNCDSMRFTGNNGNWSSTIAKTYYADKANVLTDANTGDNYYYKANKNMLKTELYKYPDGSTNELATYVYEYDAKGRVVKQTRTQDGNINIDLLTYY